MTDGVLSGIKVLEVGEGLAVTYCGKLLADYGAEVVKVELPGGDALRSAPPYRDGELTPESSGLFAFLNTSKQSVTLDWNTSDGAALLGKLTARADAIVHSFGHDRRAELGLGDPGHDSRGLIEVSITPYGLEGPYRDYAAEPLTMAALAGWMFCMGDHDKPPLYPGGPYISYLSAVNAAAGLLAALEYRAESGQGQTVEVSEHEVGVHCIPFDTLRFSYSGTYRPRSDELYGDNPTAAVYPCADGYVQFQEIRRIVEFLRIIGGDELAADERLVNADLRSLNRELIKEAFLKFLPSQKRWELFEECSKRRIVISAVPDMKELYELAPHREREYYQRGASGPLEGIELPGPPVRFGDGEWQMGPSPELGEHARAILSELTGLPAETLAALREGGRI